MQLYKAMPYVLRYLGTNFSAYFFFLAILSGDRLYQQFVDLETIGLECSFLKHLSQV